MSLIVSADRPDVTYYRCQACGYFLMAPFPHDRFIGSSTIPIRCPGNQGYQTIPAVRTA